MQRRHITQVSSSATTLKCQPSALVARRDLTSAILPDFSIVRRSYDIVHHSQILGCIRRQTRTETAADPAIHCGAEQLALKCIVPLTSP
jgi:hypothetical protein